MDTIRFDHPGLRLIAHRGIGGMECENTCTSFVLAGSRSYYGIETDIRVTKDGRYVAFHDPNLSRMTGGLQDAVVEECTYEELSRIPLISPRTGDRRTDYRIPTLADYITICKRYAKQAILEMKGVYTPEKMAGMLAIIRDLEYDRYVTYIGFSEENLLCLRAQDPDASAQILCRKEPEEDLLALMDAHRFDVGVNYKYLTREFVDLAHGHGHLVSAWCIDSPEDAIEMMRIGADLVTTNILE